MNCPMCGYNDEGHTQKLVHNVMNNYENEKGVRVTMNSMDDVLDVKGVKFVRIDPATNQKVELKPAKPAEPVKVK